MALIALILADDSVSGAALLIFCEIGSGVGGGFACGQTWLTYILYRIQPP